MGTVDAQVAKDQLERLSLFRYQLRRFLRFSEDTARDVGITALQYQLLLHTQGFPQRQWASVGELAERLQAQPHGVVALVDRCEELGLVKRKPNDTDRRLVEVHPTAKGLKCLQRLAAKHRNELASLADVIEAARNGAA